MIFSFIGCMLCLCIMAASVGGVLLSMYIVQVTADDAETLDLDNQKNKQTTIIYYCALISASFFSAAAMASSHCSLVG